MANPFTVTITQVRVSMTNPKFVSYDYQTWQAEGHDACRADRTCAARLPTSPFSLTASQRPRYSQQPLPLTRACDHVSGTVSHGPLRARNRRSRSSHKEWCLKRSEQVEVMSVERLAVRGSVDSAAPTLGRGIFG